MGADNLEIPHTDIGHNRGGICHDICHENDG